ncbi:MAG: hypothetical protein A2927_01685 [Candidatus Komeilibacteria bacterium RIFCSPLOWO2_01_FULL_45_10]|uniref:Uncharacterized protein n=1 Tax=Candidatus Komeilibacteria bacterium RIFCSPLOWO2_01_FULL_45_10 TaxID=1798550 RepID=A0A1G2BK79_9BACT|nr:MAG: hypothetical protein A2927_01685 [Candidatus Komeilibacteria bacterium RIFCSPLOWO2_01_FULL_45_10]
MWKMDKNDALENIQLLASQSFQERVWIQRIGPTVIDYNEAILMYYSSIPKVEIEALERLKTSFNEEEIRIIMKFHRILNDFIKKNGWDLTHKELMENQEWINVREEAKKVCDYFKVEPLK